MTSTTQNGTTSPLSERITESFPSKTLEQLIISRHSSRKFLPTPVPKQLLQDSLKLASHAPSNSNVQPWRLFIATGSARSRLASALLHEARLSEPNIPALPPAFKHYRTELGYQVYNIGMGISREDTAARKAAVLRNYDFFEAPVAAVVCMDKALGLVDSMGVGMYLQTLMLALTERRLSSCVEVSVAGYPEIVRREMGIGEEMEVLCGFAIGYEDPSFKGNALNTGRDDIDVTTTWLDE